MIPQKKIDIVLYSIPLRNMIRKRMKELRLNQTKLVQIAKDEGMKSISKEKLSRYFNSTRPIHGYPTQVDILWLCSRLCIDLKLKVIPMGYNEEKGKSKSIQIKKQVYG